METEGFDEGQSEETYLKDIVIFMKNAHNGQVDKMNKPFWHHPKRVGDAGITTDAKVLGYIHDVVEDTIYDLEDLDGSGCFNGDVLVALDHITHRENESYRDYIFRCCESPLAGEVKINDLRDNWSLLRFNPLDFSTQKRLNNKYRMAMRIVLDNMGVLEAQKEV